MTKDEALDKALDKALEALEESLYATTAKSQFLAFEAITAIKQARSEPYVATPLVQEPVEFFDWYDNAHWGNEDFKEGCHRSWNAAIKYTTPPASPVQEPVAYRQTGWAAHRDHYAVPVLFNPYTGHPRDVRDVQSDPQGILIVPPGKVEMLAAKPTHQQGLQVATPPAAQRQWVGLDFSEVDELAREMIKGDKSVNWLAFSIDAKLKEKNSDL
jgi:hypothetical protein